MFLRDVSLPVGNDECGQGESNDETDEAQQRAPDRQREQQDGRVQSHSLAHYLSHKYKYHKDKYHTYNSLLCDKLAQFLFKKITEPHFQAPPFQKLPQGFLRCNAP